jgi:hypothetical protein
MNIHMSFDFTRKHLHNTVVSANLFTQDSTGEILGLVSAFRRDVDEISALMECYAA